MSTFRQAVFDNPRLVLQLARLFECEAKALQGWRNESEMEAGTKREVSRLRDIACTFEAEALNAGYVGYPFGDEA